MHLQLKKKKKKKRILLKPSGKIFPQVLDITPPSRRGKSLIPQTALFLKKLPQQKGGGGGGNYVNYRSGIDVLVRKTWRAINSCKCL